MISRYSTVGSLLCTCDEDIEVYELIADFLYVVKVPNGRRSQMADGILKFMIGHLGLCSNVKLGLVEFKVCDRPPETSLNGQLQILKSCKNLVNPVKVQSWLADRKTLKSTRPS